MREFTNADLATADAQRVTLQRVRDARAELLDRAAQDLAQLVLLEALLTDREEDLSQLGMQLLQETGRAFHAALDAGTTELFQGYVHAAGRGDLAAQDDLVEDALAVCRQTLADASRLGRR